MRIQTSSWSSGRITMSSFNMSVTFSGSSSTALRAQSLRAKTQHLIRIAMDEVFWDT
jgi:hypothetical protein